MYVSDDSPSMTKAAETWETRLARRVAAAYVGDQQIRDAKPDEEISALLRRPGVRLNQIVATIMDRYADRPALGQRARDVATDPATGRRVLRLLPTFDTITYRQLWERVGVVSSALYHSADNPLRPGDFLAILGFTSTEYTVLDLVCTYLGLVCVPLQVNTPVAQLATTLAETSPRVLAVTPLLLDAAVDRVLAGETPGSLLVFDYLPEDDDQRDAVESARQRLAAAGSSVFIETLDTLISRGNTLPAVQPWSPAAADDQLALLLYTSGSTGTPKGAMYSERLASQFWAARRDIPAISYNYMPMSHGAGRGSLFSTLSRGGTVYFAARDDKSTLFDDIALVRPTELPFVPRLCDVLFQRFHSEIERRVTAGLDRTTVEQDVLAELRGRVLGDRLLMVVCGTAPLSAKMRAFTESILGLELHDGYGSTEAGGGILFDHRVQYPPVIDYQIVDVPELGYFRSDKPWPRGELLVKTTWMFPGYFKRPEITAAMFDADGFYRTGDIVAEPEPGHLIYLDRRNDVVKLAQGEFVSVSHLETLYANSPLIQQIFVYANSERAYLLAVIVPTESALSHGDAETLKAAISESLREVAREARLDSAEIPRDFLIESTPFTTDNGLLSGVGKLLRAAVTQRYGDRLEQLYTDLAAQQADELRALRRAGAADRPALETVKRAARALLGLTESELRSDAHFTDLGTDSLSVLEFATLLSEIFGAEVPVSVIADPTTSLALLADYLEKKRDPGTQRPTAASVHGIGTRLRATDLTLGKFIDTGTLDAARSLPPASQPPGTVLLTGANGYLGRFLCLDMLRQLNGADAKLICLVRGSDTAVARDRLDAAFDSGDPELLRHYRKLADNGLEVLAGDVDKPNLGLPLADWRRLAEAVDLIIHPAAYVNHVLPYGQLFGPNVAGTAEVIRLALTTRRKPVTYLSTIAVTDQIDPSLFDEDSDIRKISPVRTVDDSYANGYSNSKWAGEVLLREAHEKYGLPVAVFRSNMILAHSRYTGQLNTTDTFTRLLLSLLATGVAPKSFYQADSRGNRQHVNYDGLPADFTAAAITALGTQITDGYITYNIVNPHGDGIGLDEIVDWLAATVSPIQQIEDYSEWFGRFEAALHALPENQRRQSVLPILDTYRQPARPGPAISAARFQAATSAAASRIDNRTARLSTRLIDKYVGDLRQRQLVTI